MVPLPPAAQPLLLSIMDRAKRLLQLLFVWRSQLAPPLVVLMMVPASPTANPVWLLTGKATSWRSKRPAGARRAQLAPESVLWSTVPFSPTAVRVKPAPGPRVRLRPSRSRLVPEGTAPKAPPAARRMVPEAPTMTVVPSGMRTTSLRILVFPDTSGWYPAAAPQPRAVVEWRMVPFVPTA